MPFVELLFSFKKKNNCYNNSMLAYQVVYCLHQSDGYFQAWSQKNYFDYHVKYPFFCYNFKSSPWITCFLSHIRQTWSKVQTGNNHLHNIFAWAVKETTGTMALMQFICAIFQTPVAISQKICLSLLQINLMVFCSPLNKFSLEHFESKCPFSFTKVKTSFP